VRFLRALNVGEWCGEEWLSFNGCTFIKTLMLGITFYLVSTGGCVSLPPNFPQNIIRDEALGGWNGKK